MANTFPLSKQKAGEISSGLMKTDRRDAELILRLLLEGRFPRIWVRQLLLDRHHRMRLRTRVKNQLQALALNQGVQKGRRLWSVEGRRSCRNCP
jgi:transposase